MTSALHVQGVSKCYRIYDHPGDRLKEMVTRGRWKRHRQFWALQDIDFEIKYLAGMRFVDTAKYHGSKLLRLPSLSRFHMSNDSNFLNSLFRVGKGKSLVTLSPQTMCCFQYLIDQQNVLRGS